MWKSLAAALTAAFCCSLAINSAHAQAPTGNPGPPRGQQAPKIGKVYGKIVDDKSGRAVELATVLLMGSSPADPTKKVLLKGTQTEANGEFMLEELPVMGTLELRISAVGYKPLTMPVAFDGAGGRGSAGVADATIKDLDRIRLEPEGTALEGVTIRAQTPTFRLEGEKRIFNVDQNITSQGGTAQDVMRNVPGVLVDAEGKVTIRNAGPQILVDGRQSPLQLDQIPADVIESIEVITNPSAKYDAEGGGGGILNIVLKKNKKTGYNGSVRAGLDSRGGGNAGGDFNFRTGKFNVSASANLNRNRNQSTGEASRTDFFQNPQTRTLQESENWTTGGFGFGKLGVDYFATNRFTLSLSGNMSRGMFRPDERIDILTDTLSAGAQWMPVSFAERHTLGNNQMRRMGTELGFKKLFARKGMEWTGNATYNTGRNENESVYTNRFFTDANHNSALGLAQQKVAGSGRNSFLTVQTDFVYPVRDALKLEGGLKLTARRMQSTLNNYNWNITNGTYDQIYTPASDYKNTDNVYAAYVSASGNLNKNLGYQAGLRVESSDYVGELTQTGQRFRNTYPASLFPSLALTQKVGKDQTLQLTYRRGINRPSFWNLLPFTDFTDPLILRQGNPGLRPEFNNTAELNWTKNFGRNYLMASLYGKRTDDLITQIQTPGLNTLTGQQAIINTYINADYSLRYGVEITSQWDLAKWWTVLGNVNLYNGQINTGLTGQEANSFFAGFAKLNNTFKYQQWSLQVSGVFQSRTNLAPESRNNDGGGRGGGGYFGGGAQSSAQGYLGANWMVDAALRYSWMKNNAASLSLSVSDLFATRYFRQHWENELLVQDLSRINNPQMVRLNFNYRFGQLDTDLFRRKNTRTTEVAE